MASESFSPHTETTPSRADGFVSRRIAGDTIIVPVRSTAAGLDFIFTMNEVGSDIWKLIDGRTPLGRIAAAIAHDYDIAEAQAAADVTSFLEVLQDKGLVDRSTAGPRS